MSSQVDKLVDENKQYFRGKAPLPFEDNVTFNQCIRNPAEDNDFISIQSFKPASESSIACDILEIQKKEDDHEVFHAKDDDY